MNDDRIEIQNEIRHRLNMAQQSCGFMDEDCILYLARLVQSGAARFSDIKEVGGSEVARIIHTSKCVLELKERYTRATAR